MAELKRDLLLHPERLRIVRALVNTPMTANSLKDHLDDISQASLYRHLKALVDGGILDVVDEQRVRGGVERTYATVQSTAMLGYDDLTDVDEDEHFRLFSIFVGTLLADFGRYLARGDVDLAADRVGYTQAPLWLSDGEFDELAGEMAALVGRHLDNEATPQRRPRLLSTIIFPTDSTGTSD